MGFYVEQADRSPKSGIAAEDIALGTLVNSKSNGNVELADAASHNGIDGVARKPRTGDHVAFDIDNASDFLYDASEDDRVVYNGDEDRAIIKARTIKETNSGVTTAPSLSHDSIAVIPDTSDADAPTSAGRVVEDGYTNDENDDTNTTTFSIANGNVIPVGKVYKDESSEYDDVVRIEVRSDI